MIIGDRLRALREQKNLSQGHIQKRTGLLRCYISRVENGHTVPSIETLEKWVEHLRFRCINCSMKATARPHRFRQTLGLRPGEVLERKHDSWRNFVGC
jgi:transcriptional regulator with XRE-family HTH domain